MVDESGLGIEVRVSMWNSQVSARVSKVETGEQGLERTRGRASGVKDGTGGGGHDPGPLRHVPTIERLYISPQVVEQLRVTVGLKGLLAMSG